MLSESRRLPDSYFKGLNFLLNEEPDQAIDAFIEVAKLDSETVELHFALGNLFRRRGEIERAIRVHQSLLGRADLAPEARQDAQFELAKDFLRAGMLDRAEAGFEAVTDTGHGVEAMRYLVRIYEAGHDWPKAIEAVKRLGRLTQEAVPQRVHYYCEQAEMALAARPPQFQAVQKALDGAEQAARELAGDCTLGAKVRISLLRALWAVEEQKLQQQRDEPEPILNFAPMYSGLVAAPLMRCYDAFGQLDEGVGVLRTQLNPDPDLMVFHGLLSVMRGRREPAGL